MARDSDNLVLAVAADFIRTRGPGAFAYLNERAELAEAAGDLDSAITWWQIAITTIELLHPVKIAPAAGAS